MGGSGRFFGERHGLDRRRGHGETSPFRPSLAPARTLAAGVAAAHLLALRRRVDLQQEAAGDVEDAAAAVDLNLVMNAAGEFIELQGTGEEATFTDTQLAEMLKLGKIGLKQLFAAQQAALAE